MKDKKNNKKYKQMGKTFKSLLAIAGLLLTFNAQAQYGQQYVRVRIFSDKIFLLKVWYDRHSDERMQLRILSKEVPHG